MSVSEVDRSPYGSGDGNVAGIARSTYAVAASDGVVPCACTTGVAAAVSGDDIVEVLAGKCDIPVRAVDYDRCPYSIIKH